MRADTAAVPPKRINGYTASASAPRLLQSLGVRHQWERNNRKERKRESKKERDRERMCVREKKGVREKED